MHKTSMSPRVCGFYKSQHMESLVIQTQVYSVGTGVIVLHITRAECCLVQEYVDSVNPVTYEE